MPDFKFCICRKIVPRADEYCDTCKIEIQKRLIERKKHYNKVYDKQYRNSNTAKFYHSNKWVQLSNRIKINAGELCQLCLSNFKITSGNLTHHIIALNDCWGKRLDPLNCIYVCNKCHKSIHIEYEKDEEAKKQMQSLLSDLVLQLNKY